MNERGVVQSKTYKSRLVGCGLRTSAFERMHAVAGGLYDAASMCCDRGIGKRLPESLELGERAFFVPAHQKALAGDIRRQYNR
jgi:hypothetical protein